MNQRIPAICMANAGFMAWITVCFLILGGWAQAVPQAPNESWIVGEVVEIERFDSLTLKIEPAQTLFRCKLRILSVEAVGGAENILRGYEGKVIEALARDALGAGEVKGKFIKARVAFHGDERSGHYWILESMPVARPR